MKRLIQTKNFTEPCHECYENSGVEVFYDTKIRTYTLAPRIYGHYRMQTEKENGRVHFKKGTGDHALGIWWNGSASWTIGLYSDKGTNNCIGFFINDALCPHQIKERNGKLFHGEGIGLKDAENSLVIKSSPLDRGNFLISLIPKICLTGDTIRQIDIVSRCFEDKNNNFCETKLVKMLFVYY